MTLTIAEYAILKGAEDSGIPGSRMSIIGEKEIIQDLYNKKLLDLDAGANFILTEEGRKVLKKAEHQERG